ncbi:MAG TPA: hypothetical protein ENJ93_06765 [Chloroflexi bacterium]|nr:hypothetical protein [Chloroflexota bacterium]
MRRILSLFLWVVLFLAACQADAPITPSPTAVPSTATSLLLTAVPPAATALPPTAVDTAVPPSPHPPTPHPLTPEIPVTEIPLAGPIANRNAEISGLAWYGDTLILLPQYPDFNGRGPADGYVYALPRADIEAFLRGELAGPLEPQAVPFVAPGLGRSVKGFEGYEAIAFDGETAYLTIEASGGGMMGYLARGSIAPDLSALTLDVNQIAPIEPQTDIGNLSDEAVLWADGRILTFYEANGAVNPSPAAHLFDAELKEMGTAVFPRVEYRITDATEVDGDGRFWAINYNYPGNKELQTDDDPLAEMYGEGPTHAQSDGVERLLQFQYDESGVSLIEQPPVQLQLADDLRNWEGIVRLGDQGFLLVTDKFPTTILGFVPLPEG